MNINNYFKESNNNINSNINGENSRKRKRDGKGDQPQKRIKIEEIASNILNYNMNPELEKRLDHSLDHLQLLVGIKKINNNKMEDAEDRLDSPIDELNNVVSSNIPFREDSVWSDDDMDVEMQDLIASICKLKLEKKMQSNFQELCGASLYDSPLEKIDLGLENGR